MGFGKLIAALAALVGLGAVSQCARAANHGFPVDWDRSHAGESLDLKGYKLVFADEFDQLRLGREGGPGPWYAPIHTALGMGDLAVPPDPAYAVADGELRLTTRLEAGRWREANLQTQDAAGAGFAQQNGYFEARIALPLEHGAHAGFWLLSRHDRDHGHAEFDVVEAYGAGGRWGHHSTSHIWPGRLSGVRAIFTSNITPIPSLLSGFHTFGALADRDRFVVYYDRKEVARIARQPEQQAPLYMLISLFENGGDPPQEPASMRVDWVRAYAPPP
jgi:beta-glucanase (GH16 family)